jgi:hypothetical protein
VVPGDSYGFAYLLRITNENSGTLKFTRARALREITGYGYDVELLSLDGILDRVDLGRYRWPAEMQI